MAASKLKQIEKEKGKPMPEVLLEMYEIYGSQTAIAKALGVNQSTLSLWMTRFGLTEKRILIKEERA